MICPVLPEDISAVARALLAAPVDQRQARCRVIYNGAGLAASHLRTTGKLHQHWGDGSLSAAARRFPLEREPRWDQLDYLDCLLMALSELQRTLIRAGRKGECQGRA